MGGKCWEVIAAVSWKSGKSNNKDLQEWELDRYHTNAIWQRAA